MHDPTKPTRLPGEGLVVTEDGQRVDGRIYATEEDAAKAAAARKNKLVEKSGAPVPAVAVKTQLFG